MISSEKMKTRSDSPGTKWYPPCTSVTSKTAAQTERAATIHTSFSLLPAKRCFRIPARRTPSSIRAIDPPALLRTNMYSLVSGCLTGKRLTFRVPHFCHCKVRRSFVVPHPQKLGAQPVATLWLAFRMHDCRPSCAVHDWWSRTGISNQVFFAVPPGLPPPLLQHLRRRFG